MLLLALVGGSITGLLNMIGALPIFFVKRIPQKVIDIGLGFATGVMLGASFTSLIIPSIQSYGLIQTLFGIVLGNCSGFERPIIASYALYNWKGRVSK